MDALDRIEPVARPLLEAVDTALTSLGAPPEHEIWGLLREAGVTPADAVRGIAEMAPGRLRDAAGQARRLGQAYLDAAAVPMPSWQGRAGGEYAVQASALAGYLGDDLPGAVRDTAGYLDAVAEWQQRSRNQTAAALAEVLVSAEAATLLRARAAGLGETGVVGPDSTGLSRSAVLAAAGAGAHVLRVVRDVLAAGADLTRAWAGAAGARPMRGTTGPAPTAHTIEVRH